MADKNKTDKAKYVGHDDELDQMMAELELALAADQKKRQIGLQATTNAARQSKEQELLNKVEQQSRQATQRMQAMPQAGYPMPVQPGAQGPQGPAPMAMAPPIKAQPMPAGGPPPGPPPTQMPTPQPMAMAPPIQGQPMPTPGPPPPQMPGPPPAGPMVSPEQWAMMQQELYGGQA